MTPRRFRRDTFPMRRAFTLLEVVAVVAIIAVVSATAFIGMGSGGGAARLRGATRAVFATVRQARSVALVTQKPAVVTYSNVVVDGEPCIRVVLDSVKLMDTGSSRIAQTLSGETVDLADPTGEIAAARAKAAAEGEAAPADADDGGGESIEDILFAPVDESVLGGMSIKVVVGGGDDDMRDAEAKRSVVSAFSNVDSLLGRYSEAKKKDDERKSETDETDGDAEGGLEPSEDLMAPVSVAWEPNGRCEPHRIWVYRAGKSPEKGLSITVDRFGAARVAAVGEDEP